MHIPNEFDELRETLKPMIEMSVIRATREYQFASLKARESYQDHLRGVAADWLHERWLRGVFQRKQFVSPEGWFMTSFRRLFQEHPPASEVAANESQRSI